MIIDVYRGDGLRSGNPVIEPLLSDEALLQRGIAEMDRYAHPLQQIELDVVFRPGLQLGQLVEALDPSSAQPYRAKITGIEIQVTETSIHTRLTLERPQ